MEIAAIETTGALEARADFTADPAELSRAVTYLAKRITSRRNRVPILDCVHVAADPGGTVTLIATNLDQWARVTIPATVETPGEFCTPAHNLAGVIDKARKDKDCWQVRITEGEARATIQARRGRFTVPRQPVDDFPDCPTVDETLSRFTVPAPRLLQDLAALAPCMSKEDVSRYFLCGVAVQVRQLGGQDRLALVAMDGGNMAIASRPMPIGAESLPDAILPADAITALHHAGKLATDCEAVAMAFTAKAARIELGPVTITTKLVDGTYPDWAGDKLWSAALAPTGEAGALFPELLPGSPAPALEKLAKAAPGPVTWQPAASGLLGTVQGDDGLFYAAMALGGAGCGKSGFTYPMEGGVDARPYLLALAETRGTPLPADIEARCEAINAEWSDWSNDQVNGLAPYGKAECRVEVIRCGGREVGLTIAGMHKRYGWRETVQDWEALVMRTVDHPETVEPVEGSYSILMPADAPQATHSSWIDGPDGVRYPVADNDRAIHMSKEQVRALIGESCFETIELATGYYVCRWLWEQGDSRLLLVGKDGRIRGEGRSYVTRAEAEAMLAGKGAEAVAAPTVDEMPQIEPLATAESDCEADPVSEGGEGFDALREAPSGPVELSSNAEQLPDPIADVMDRLDALERRVDALPAQGAEAAPPTARAKRTPAHERAIRRAWAERQRRRDDAAERKTWAAFYERVVQERNDLLDQRDKRRRAVLNARRHWKMRLVARGQYKAAEQGELRQYQARERTATRARRMLADARQAATFQRQRADVLHAQLDKLKADMADPSQPERASDLVQLRRERDAARTALAAVQARAERAESAVVTVADKLDEMASRVARAEAALRQAQAA